MKVGQLTVGALTPEGAANVVWEAGNSPEETLLTLAYRAWEVRSLSKGDVLSIAVETFDDGEPVDSDPVAVLSCESSGWAPVDLAGFIRRERLDPGMDFIRQAYEEGERGPVDVPRMWERVDAQIQAMKWKAPNGRFPMTPGMELQDIVKGLDLPNVSAVSYGGYLRLPDGPETGTYPLYGIEANYSKGGPMRVYVLGAGSKACPLTVDWCPVPPTVPATGGSRTEYRHERHGWVPCEVTASPRDGVFTVDLGRTQPWAGVEYNVPASQIRHV